MSARPACGSGLRGVWSVVMLLLGVAPLCGCQAFNEHRAALRDMQAQGRYDLAAQALDNPETQRLYGKNDQLLWWLDRGSVALAGHQDKEAIELLEKADAFMDVRHGPSAGDVAAQWLVNDTATEYIGEAYESIYVNVLKLLAQLERGVITGGATVEARRAAGKADHLRDLYLKYGEAVHKQGGPELSREMRRSAAEGSVEGGGAPPPPSMVSHTQSGEFIESPLGTFLTAVTFMASGDRDLQEVAGRRLLESIRVEQGLIGPVRAEDFQGVGERSPTGHDLLVVALSGRAPTKVAERFGPIPIYQWPVYFEIPVLRGGSAEVASARVLVAPPPQAGAAFAEPNPGDVTSYRLALVEDMRAVATENHRRELPLIYARAFLRSSAKAAAAFAASQAVTNGGRKGGWTNIAAIVGGLAFVAITERADLRSWVFLPGEAHVGLFELPPGPHMVRIEYLAAGGGLLYATPWRRVDPEQDCGVGEGGGRLCTVVETFWR